MPNLTKRQFIAGAAGSVLLSRRSFAADLLPHEAALYDAAKKEGELTWYSGQLQAETGEAVGKAFTARYPGIKVNVVRSTSQVAYQRLSQDMQAGVAQCDMFSSTDYGHYLFLKREEKLLPYRPRNSESMIAAACSAVG